MSLDHAILGLLNYEPMTGYDLKKMIDTSIAHFWPAVQSQIYKTLGHLETSGLVDVEIIPQEARPPRKVYTITPAGRDELFSWLAEPQPIAEVRLAWLIQVFFGGRMSDEQVIALLEQRLAQLRQRLQAFSAVPEDNREQMSQDDPRERFFWLLTVDYGVSQSVAQVRWLETVITGLRKGEYRLPTLEA